MAESVEEIADRMRVAAEDPERSQQTLASLFAEQVELRHVPPSSSDGPIPGALLSEVSRREVEASGRALVGPVERESEITVEGDAIRVRSRIAGVLADGSTVDLRTNTVFTVTDGAITALQSDMDAASMATWGKALVAGGFEVPEGIV